MKIISQYILAGAFFLLVTGCSSIKGLQSNKPATEITEKAEMEYLYHFIEANKLKTLGYYDEAVANLTKCLEIKPGAAAVNYELANIYIFNKDYYKALSYAKIASEKDAKNIWYQLLYANLLLQNKDYKEAITSLEKAQKQHPENMEVKLLLASIYASNSKFSKKALALYNQLESNYGFNEKLAFEKEKLYMNLGETDKALEEIRKLTLLDPENPRYYGLYAESLINEGKYTEAENVYKTLFELDPGNGLAHLSFGEYLLNKGEKEAALKEFMLGMQDESLDAKPKGNMIVKLETTYNKTVSKAEIIELIKAVNKVHIHNLQGHAMLADYYTADGEYALAREEIQIILSKQKDVSRIWDQLHTLDYLLNDYQALYDHSKEAIELFPNYNKFYLMQGYACEKLKKYEEGIEMLEMGADFVVDDEQLASEFYSQIGELENRLKRHQKSDAAFEKALEFNPKNMQVLNNYSYYLSMRGEKLDIALKKIELANIIAPDNSTYLDSYAWVFYKMNRFSEALEKIEKAIKYGGDKSAVIVDHYGDILYRLNKIEAAKQQWKQAKQLGLSGPDIDYKIEFGKIKD